MEDVLYPIPAWQIAALLFALIVAMIVVGYRIGRARLAAGEDRASGSFTTILGAVLGVLGLLLAFSFSMAVERYDLRKRLILQEANAIGTAYLRSALLAEPARTQMRDLLRAYTDERLARYQADVDPARAERASVESRRLQEAAWNIAAAQAVADPHAVAAGLLVQSLNEMIDLSAERSAARQNHVPETVLFMLLLAVLLTAVLVGFAFGKSGDRNLLTGLVFSLLVALVVFVILDLDRPRRGFIRVNEEVMSDLRRSLGSVSAHPPTRAE